MIKKRFVICGVPRSGTTILARVIGSLPGFVCLHEPLQTEARHGFILLPDGTQTNEPFPTLMDRLDGAYDHVGFKEPYMLSEGYAVRTNAELLIPFFESDAITKIWLLRHPVEVFNSQLRWKWPEPYRDITRFLQNYGAFLRWVTPPFIDYGWLVRDPLTQLQRVGIETAEVPRTLLPLVNSQKFVGCHEAFAAPAIQQVDCKDVTPLDSKRQILDSAVFQTYRDLLMSAATPTPNHSEKRLPNPST